MHFTTPPDNPWHRLPSQPQYILPEDEAAVLAFNKRVRADHRYDLSLLPEPFSGSPSAPVLLLLLNPGLSPEDIAIHRDPNFVELSRQSLNHQLQPDPFLHLQPNLNTPGAKWWRRIAKPLIQAVGDEQKVARSIFCVQYFPYHSKAFHSAGLPVSSQNYSFHLVRSALARNALVVVMRSWRLWSNAIPELLDHHQRCYRIKNPRNPTLSPNNIPNGFNSILRRIQTGA